MPSYDAYYQGLFETARQGALVLTVNKRLARHLRRLFDRSMIEQQLGAWKSPEIFSLDDWFLSCHDRLHPEAHKIGDFHARLIWEEIIENSLEGVPGGLLQVPSAAQLALEAHSLVVEYGVRIEEAAINEDHQAFLEWRRSYETLLAEKGWTDPARIYERLCADIEDRVLALASRVMLVGFDEIPPRVKRLRSALQSVGCCVSEVFFPSAEIFCAQRISCPDISDEIRSAARWTRALLKGEASNIGVVVADLGLYKDRIEQIFREEIDPGSLAALEPAANTFNLSLGQSLAAQGPIAAALQILGLGHSLSLDQAGFVLRTPFVGGSLSERTSRALLEPELREGGIRRISLKGLASLCRKGLGRSGNHKAPILAAMLESLCSGRLQGGKHHPGDWALKFSRILELFGWPGEPGLDSNGYQAVKAWREKVLSILCTFDGIRTFIDASEALTLVQRLAAETLFQPEGQSTGVQVLGLLEASGLGFDHLWVLGLSAESVPAAVRPNPFLPPGLQRQLGMPRANPEKELAYAREILERLCASASEVVLSHPRFDGDCPLKPSSLILSARDITCPDEDSLRRFPPRTEGFRMEILSDTRGPQISGSEPLRGGTSLLKDQALCPFRAFAHHRLGVRALEEGDIGLDALSRGNLVHAVLEHFWKATRDSQTLAALTDEDVTLQMGQCAESVVKEFFDPRRGQFPDPMQDLERNRVAELACEWVFKVERARGPFSVLHLEEPLSVDIAGLSIRARADRVDELPDGTRVVIDYKTGSPRVEDLLGERIIEPQLPIYAGSIPVGLLEGVCFGVLRKGECAARAVARSSDVFPRVEAFAQSPHAEKSAIAGWEELLGLWKERLEALGREFAAGEASVMPFDRTRACRSCDLGSLCRIGDAVEEGEQGE